MLLTIYLKIVHVRRLFQHHFCHVVDELKVEGVLDIDLVLDTQFHAVGVVLRQLGIGKPAYSRP